MTRSRREHAAPSTSLGIDRSHYLWTVLLVCCGVLSYFSAAPHLPTIIAVSAVAFYLFFQSLDERPPVREIAAVVATLQLLVGPWFLYTYFNNHYRYRMYVDADTYFSYAIPGVCCYILGALSWIPVGRSQPRIVAQGAGDMRIGVTLVIIGLAASVATRVAPSSLAFLFYLLGNLRYVGAIYVMHTGHRLRWPIVAVVASGLLLTSARHGMFHELLLWGALGGSYWFVGARRPLILKVALVLAGFFVVSVVQGIKQDYREQLRNTADASLVGSVVRFLAAPDSFAEDWQQSMVVRMSQGWIVSAAMRTVPTTVPFARGSTLYDAIYAAIVPRTFDPDKKTATGRNNVNRFTRLGLRKGTAMGISPLGEGYVNFGVLGGIIVMFCYGIVINIVYRVLAKLSWKDDFFLYCMPLVFLQPVKVETEFLTVLNHFTKSAVVVFITYSTVKYVRRRRQRLARVMPIPPTAVRR